MIMDSSRRNQPTKGDRMSGIQIQVPAGHKIVHRISYDIPDHFHALQGVRIDGRKWWQFWLPREVVVYCTVEESKKAAPERKE